MNKKQRSATDLPLIGNLTQDYGGIGPIRLADARGIA